MKTEKVIIKKLRKNGNISDSISRKIVDYLVNEKIVLMPTDSIYGLTSTMNRKSSQFISKLTGQKEEDIIRMVSSFKMLDEIADIDKLEFDFLHRIWPGELIVYLKGIDGINKSIPVRMPRNKYQQKIIEAVGEPLLCTALYSSKDRLIYRKKDILKIYKDKIDFKLIIEEFCKERPYPSVVDVSSGGLSIINEGRISSDEIKSLYFLGKG